MESTTKLRALRLQYGISLNDLAVQSGISNQQFSRLELGLVKRTPHKERLANAALLRVIDARRSALYELEAAYEACRGRLLMPMEENGDEL
ncbi:helix-turn-helix transcriptional regulator [Intestinimonas butyriciproducens]|jgi:transcriptional regulator with XRE-family HTH domain|uniref:helix-turn-helix domain-containing protein n=1 Tax=Intestinimonas butyriciproducens TaxID=1297617 RepID=UPI00242FA255